MDKPSDVDRYADLSLDLACPKCGSGGLIPLKQLDRMLFCFGCQSRFGVEPQGLVELDQDRIHVQVRRHLSDWEGHDAILQSRSARFGTWLLDYAIVFLSEGWGRWALGVGLVVVIGVGVAIATRTPAAKPPPVVPDALDARAEMFTTALARRDMEILTRLTDPAAHRALRIWLAHGAGIPKPIEDKEADVSVKVANTTIGPEGDRANVRVALATPADTSINLDEQWVRRGEIWYFQPVRFRSPAVNKGSTQPYTKRPKR